MEAFVKWLVGLLSLAICCLLDGLLAMVILNQVFSLTVGYWEWVGVSFVLVEIVTSGTALQKARG